MSPKQNPIAPEPKPKNRTQVNLVEVAIQKLSFLEDPANAAREHLGDGAEVPAGGAGIFATVNTMTSNRAAQNLPDINAYLAREPHQLASEPAIAGLMLADEDGGEQVHFIDLAERYPAATMARVWRASGRFSADRPRSSVSSEARCYSIPLA